MLLLHEIDKTLQVEQGGMALVAVEQVALDAEFLEHQHTADAEEVFLLDTVFPVAAVELVGDGAVKLRVHLEVSVHQIEIHTAYIDTPHMAVNDSVVVGHLKNHRTARLLHNLLDGELVEVLGLIICNLLAIHAECLREVAVTIKEADSCHGHA